MAWFAPKLTEEEKQNISKLLPKFKEEQNALREKIILQPISEPINYIAGCDSSLIGENIFSIFVIFKFPELEEVEIQTHTSRLEIPYIPGFLSFREIPNHLKAYEKIKTIPDLIMVDGNGIMHPRRLGIATHLGLTLNKPTIGVAKKKLYGKISQEIPDNKNSYVEVADPKTNEIIGYALRSKDRAKPILVSPGHLCDLNSALQITMQCLRKHKLPEPTRIADLYSKTMKNI